MENKICLIAANVFVTPVFFLAPLVCDEIFFRKMSPFGQYVATAITKVALMIFSNQVSKYDMKGKVIICDFSMEELYSYMSKMFFSGSFIASIVTTFGIKYMIDMHRNHEDESSIEDEITEIYTNNYCTIFIKESS